METDSPILEFPFTVEQVTLIYYGKLEDFAQSVYGKKPDFGRWLEADQDTIHDLEVNKDPRYLELWDQNVSDEEYLSYAEQELQNWIDSPSDFSWENSTKVNPALIAWDLARKGLIPEGKFKLHVWW